MKQVNVLKMLTKKVADKYLQPSFLTPVSIKKLGMVNSQLC